MPTTDNQPAQLNRAGRRALLQPHRQRKLPATWLGTGGHPDPADDGWQDSMWWHPLYAAGGTYLAGTGIDHALRAGVVDPLPLLAGLAIPPAGVVGTATALLGAAGGLAGLVATAGDRFSGWARAMLTFGPAAAGAWLTSVAATSPYNVPNLAAAAFGTAAGMLLYRRARDEQDHHEAAWVAQFAVPEQRPASAPTSPPPSPIVVEQLDPELRLWDTALARVGLKGCRARKREDTPAGFAILVRFPTSGTVGRAQVEAKTEALERALGMLEDVLDVDVALDPVTGRVLSDRCWIHVDVEDILAKILPMPGGSDTTGPTTINKAFRIGTYANGQPMVLRLREISALIVGVRGRGKTNLLHVFVHQLSRCTDVVLWAIDLKGGRAVKPWLAAWLSGDADRPIFDWVATTRAESALMLHAAEALIAHRGTASHGGSKIDPSEEHPAVLILCDEIAALVGKHAGPRMPGKGPDAWRNPTANQMSAALTRIIQLGRSEAVDVALFSQRATVTMVGGGDLKSQCELRIGLGVTNAGDAASVFQNDGDLARKLRKLKHKRTRGACLVENGDDPNHLAGKTWFYGDGTQMLANIRHTSIAHAMHPADLPEMEQRAIDTALRILTSDTCGYGVGQAGGEAERWSLERAEHLYTADGELPDDWVDDDTGDGDNLGGDGPHRHLSIVPEPGGAVATRAPAPRQTRPAGQVDDRGQRHGRYYTPRAERRGDGTEAGDPTGEPTDTAAVRPSVPAGGEDLDPDGMAAGFAAWLDTLPTTDDPPPLAGGDAPEELSRYDLMVEIIREAGPAGIMAGQVYRLMESRGRAWAHRPDIYPALKRALADRQIVQPSGPRGRYYHRTHTPRPA